MSGQVDAGAPASLRSTSPHRHAIQAEAMHLVPFGKSSSPRQRFMPPIETSASLFLLAARTNGHHFVLAWSSVITLPSFHARTGTKPRRGVVANPCHRVGRGESCSYLPSL